MNDVTKHKQLGTPRRWGPPREIHCTEEVLRPRPVDLTMPFAGWVVVILTAVLALTAGLQAWAFMQSQRAFVFPTAANFTGPLVANVQPLSLYIDISNSGESAAKIEDLTAFVTHHLAPRPQYDEGPLRIKVASPPIPAGGTLRRILHFGEPWGEDTTSAVKGGTMRFYMYGRINYRDDYSLGLGALGLGVRQSDFCFVYVPNVDPGKAVFRNCPEPVYTNIN